MRRSITPVLMLFLFVTMGFGAEPAATMTYDKLRHEGAKEFIRLAEKNWEAGETRRAVTLALRADRIRSQSFEGEDPRGQRIEAMVLRAVELIRGEDDSEHTLLFMNLNELRGLAEAGDADAAHEVGLRYQNGLGGLTVDAPEAIYWFRMALEGEKVDTRFQLALAMWGNRFRAETRSLWARQGPRPVPLAPLGGATPEEFELFNTAHEAGHTGAKAFVGLSLIAQEIRHSDEETRAAQQKGWSLLQEAARSGDPWGQYLLAHALAEGFGIAQNRRLALTWANRAADHGLAQAQGLLAHLLLPALGAATQDSTPAASASAEKGWVMLFCAARQGDWLAHYNLGLRLMKGEGIAKDARVGLEWLEQASGAGHLLASQALIQYR